MLIVVLVVLCVASLAAAELQTMRLQHLAAKDGRTPPKCGA